MTTYVITKPTGAYPRLPFHLIRRVEEVDESSGIRFGRRETFVASFPTRELAEGKIPDGAVREIQC